MKYQTCEKRPSTLPRVTKPTRGTLFLFTFFNRTEKFNRTLFFFPFNYTHTHDTTLQLLLHYFY